MPIDSAASPRPPAIRSRPLIHATVSPDTLARLTLIMRGLDLPLGRSIDALSRMVSAQTLRAELARIGESVSESRERLAALPK